MAAGYWLLAFQRYVDWFLLGYLHWQGTHYLNSSELLLVGVFNDITQEVPQPPCAPVWALGLRWCSPGQHYSGGWLYQENTDSGTEELWAAPKHLTVTRRPLESALSDRCVNTWDPRAQEQKADILAQGLSQEQCGSCRNVQTRSAWRVSPSLSLLRSLLVLRKEELELCIIHSTNNCL